MTEPVDIIQYVYSKWPDVYEINLDWVLENYGPDLQVMSELCLAWLEDAGFKIPDTFVSYISLEDAEADTIDNAIKQAKLNFKFNAIDNLFD